MDGHSVKTAVGSDERGAEAHKSVAESDYDHFAYAVGFSGSFEVISVRKRSEVDLT
jgi:hypothetical protein